MRKKFVPSRVEHKVKVSIADEYGDIYDSYHFDHLSKAMEFANSYDLKSVNDKVSYEFIKLELDDKGSVIRTLYSEDGVVYDNGSRVPESVFR